ncbi:MAG TPA: protein kinase [Burkholderiales bacterium]|jgi:serine/threonine protein kinase|nr:protein kinase [Burkholderiales bacterium]
MATGPQTLGRYQLERILGKGAMGIVYEALDPKLHRKVAIKTILISQLDEETAKDFSMRFVREAHAVARLNHPNIVQVYDFGEEGNIAYLVMEFIRGNELKSSLTTGQLFDRKECVRIMCELLDALEFAHEAGVVHRDIKPANVMLDGQGRTKLTDFGVARVTDADRTNAERTQAGTMVGTPAYMSPEQIQGQKIDRRTDIFSAGVILYQFLTGQKPFIGEGAWTVAKKIIQDDPPMPSSLNVSVPPEFDRVVAKALAKNPDDRFSTAREFAGALRRAAEGKPALPEAEPTVVVPREPRVLQATHTPEALRSGEMELEFWRSIKDSDDPNDFELYVRQFPQGVYASLAARKAAKLRSGSPADDSGTRTMSGEDRTRLQKSVPRAEGEQSVRPAADKTIKLADAASLAPTGQKKSLLVPGILGVLLLSGAAAYFFAVKPSQQSAAQKIETEAKAGRDAAEAAKAEAQAKRESQVQAQREAQAKRDSEAQAKQAAEAQAQREAELKAKRDAEAKTQRAAAAQAKREAEVQTKREAEAQARREAEARAKREAETKAQRETDAQAQREAEAKAQREAKAKAQRDAESKGKLAAESSLWDSVKSSSKPADLQKYLNRYPNGQYADLARQRMQALEAQRLKEQEQRQSQAREAEAARKQKDAERKKSTIIVPPTF